MTSQETRPASPDRQATEAVRSGSRTVFSILLSQVWTSTVLPLAGPLLIGAFILLLAWVHASLTGHRLGDYGGFINHTSAHSTLLPIFFGLTIFLSYRSQARLLLSLGLGRWDYLRGYLLLALYRSFLATLVYGLTSLLELASRGYGRDWMIMNQQLNTWVFAFNQTYTDAARAYNLIDYLANWFLVLLGVQLAGMTLAACYLRWGSRVGTVLLLLALAWILSISRNLYGTLMPDLGIGMLWEQGNYPAQPPTIWDYAQENGGVVEEGIVIIQHPGWDFVINYYLGLILPICAAYLALTITWAKTSFR